jgi:hypothetical protein
MLEIEYLTDENGNKKAVVIPIDVWQKLFPEETMNLEELSEKLADYCLNKAMDEATTTPLLDRETALQYLEE